MAKLVDPEEARDLLRIVVAEQERKLRERMMAERPPVGVAKQRLRVVSERRDANGTWYWRLPLLEEVRPDAQVVDVWGK